MDKQKNGLKDKSAAVKLIREQGEQIRREEVDEYITRKHGKSGMQIKMR